MLSTCVKIGTAHSRLQLPVAKHKAVRVRMTHRTLSSLAHAVNSRLVGATGLQAVAHMLLRWP